MLDNSAIEELEIPLWSSQKLFVALKTIHGREYLDVRKWVPTTLAKWTQGYAPSKGVMLELDDWPPVIKGLQTMLDAHSKGIR